MDDPVIVLRQWAVERGVDWGYKCRINGCHAEPQAIEEWIQRAYAFVLSGSFDPTVAAADLAEMP